MLIIPVLTTFLFCLSDSGGNLGAAEDNIQVALNRREAVPALSYDTLGQSRVVPRDSHVVANSAFGYAFDLMSRFLDAEDDSKSEVLERLQLLNSYRLRQVISRDEWELIQSDEFWQVIEADRENLHIAAYYLRGEVLQCGGLREFFASNMFFDSSTRIVLLQLLFSYQSALRRTLNSTLEIYNKQYEQSSKGLLAMLIFLGPPYQWDIAVLEGQNSRIQVMIGSILGLSEQTSYSINTEYTEIVRKRVARLERALVVGDVANVLSLHPRLENGNESKFEDSWGQTIFGSSFALAAAKEHLVATTIPAMVKNGLVPVVEVNGQDRIEIAMRGIFAGHFLSDEQIRVVGHFLKDRNARRIIEKSLWTTYERDFIARELVAHRREFVTKGARDFILGVLANLFAPVYFADSPFDNEFSSWEEIDF